MQVRAGADEREERGVVWALDGLFDLTDPTVPDEHSSTEGRHVQGLSDKERTVV